MTGEDDEDMSYMRIQQSSSGDEHGARSSSGQGVVSRR